MERKEFGFKNKKAYFKAGLGCCIAIAALLLPCGGAAAKQDAGREAKLERRAQAYAKAHPDSTLEDARLAIILKLDEENYKHVVTVSDPAALSVFVSKHYALPLDYKPDDLVAVDQKYALKGVRLRRECYEAFLSMAKDMEAEGLTLYMQSGYRTNVKRGGADSLWYAWPGHSEHQTGLAFDLRKKNVTYKTLGAYKYHRTKEFAWLCKHGWEYGFILSYPKGESDITGFGFEPWHWRYVGGAIAADMKEKGFETYQEYWAAYLA